MDAPHLPQVVVERSAHQLHQTTVRGVDDAHHLRHLGFCGAGALVNADQPEELSGATMDARRSKALGRGPVARCLRMEAAHASGVIVDVSTSKS